jgi:hypothetical protein
MGHLLIENRHGLIVDVRTTHANGMAEREGGGLDDPGGCPVAPHHGRVG